MIVSKTEEEQYDGVEYLSFSFYNRFYFTSYRFYGEGDYGMAENTRA